MHICPVIVACVLSTDSTPPQWPQFLGPQGTAVVATTPATLGFDLAEDVRWRAEVPKGSSSPCIWGDRIFMTGAEGDRLVMLALDRATGEEIWRRTVAAGATGPIAHVDKDPAAPTPCTDGERVVFYFGGYGLVVCDLDGELQWEKKLPLPNAPFGIGTSPILFEDRIVLSRDGCPDSGVFALALADGSERWSIPRLNCTFSFGTPFVWRRDTASPELLVAGTQQLLSLDPDDGSENWRVKGLADFICTTPTADADTVYFASWSTGGASIEERSQVGWGDMVLSPAEQADARVLFDRLDADDDQRLVREELPPSRALDAFGFFDRSGDGGISLEEFLPVMTSPASNGKNLVIAVSDAGSVKWSARRGIPYVASPLLHEGRLYMLKTGGLVTCLDPATGRPHFDRERLDDHSEYYASPVGVPGHVILCSSAGTVYVIRTSDDFEVVHQVAMNEPITATPAILDGTIYLRSGGSLRAFGRRPSAE